MPAAVINPKTGKFTVSRDVIKKVSLQYRKDTLENNPPEAEAIRGAEVKDILQETRLKDGDGMFMVEKDLFEKILH